MQTKLQGKKAAATIQRDGAFVIIGEKINPTGRKKMLAALLEQNYDFIRDLAIQQVEAGADVLDINVGAPGIDEVHVLPEVVKLVAEVVDIPLCLDSANPDALAAALAVAPGRPLVNSVTGEEKSLNSVLPVVAEHKAAVIGLVMDENGIASDPEVRLAIAERILERAAQEGIASEDVVIDPLVMAVGADSNAAMVTLRTIEMVRQQFGVNINLGASNVSFGLPDRHTVNQSFLALAMGFGATCAITDPIKLTPTIRASDLLLGRDSYGMRYIKYWRAHQPKEEATSAG
jgi:5-methyltetrahydrofolate--homocysteine methyltransferase